MKIKINRKAILSFSVVLLLGFSVKLSEKPAGKSLLAFIGKNKTIIVWDSETRKQDTIADLPDKLNIHSLAFEGEHKVVYSITSNYDYYLYSEKTGDTLRISEASMNEIINFMDSNSSGNYHEFEEFVDTIYAISINEHTLWKEKIIKFELKDQKNAKIQTLTYDSSGQLLFTHDTNFVCEKVNNIRNLKCEQSDFIWQRFYSQSEIYNNTYYFTQKGNLYKMENGEKSLFIEFTKKFDSATRSGYFNPTVNYAGTIMLVCYSEYGLFANKKNSRGDLLKIDLRTKKIEILSKKNFRFPKFSPNGAFCSMNLIETNRGHKTFEIYVYDVYNKEFIHLGSGNSAIWLGSKH